MSPERQIKLPFESDPSNEAGVTVIVDRERLFSTWSPEPKTPEGYLEDFFRDVAVLPDIHGVAFSRVKWNGGISIEPIITTNIRSSSSNSYFNEVLGPRVKTAIETLKVGLGLKKTYHCFANTTPENLETATEAFRNEWASSKKATLLRLVLFK